MRGVGVGAAAVLGAAVLCAGAACGDAFTTGSGAGDGGPEAGLLDGPAIEAPGGGSSGGEAAPGETGSGDAFGGPDAPAGHVIYVAPTGDDTHTGLLQSLPKRTIASALTEAAVAAGKFTVQVCAGTYSEAKLNVASDVVLLGGYDCKTWTRSATYGFPTFDPSVQTIITNADLATQAATLEISGTVTSATLVDGFVIEGASPATSPTIGVHVAGSAAPVLKNDDIGGGVGQGGTTAIGSHGVLVDGSAAPEITACLIDGGTGSGSEGSVGAYLNTSGAVNLHAAVVTGGHGTATLSGALSAVGVVVHTALPTSTPLSELVVSGTDSTGTTGNSAGIYVDGVNASSPVSAVISECAVSGGLGTGANGTSDGVLVNAAGGTVAIVGDRIHGGARSAGSSQTFGVLVRSVGPLLVADSMIHGGTVPKADGSYAVGVSLGSVAGAALVYDTIYTGSAAGTAIALNAGVSNTTITDDLLLGSDDTSLGSFGVGTTACSGMIATLDHTAFGNLGDLYQCASGEGGPPVDVTTLPVLAAQVGVTQTAGDVVIQSTCSVTTGGCAAVSGCPQAGEGCAASLFGSSWSSDDGVCSLLQACGTDAGVPTDGWMLAPGSPCALTRGGIPVTSVTSDIYGNPRTGQTSTMGAAEYTAGACK